MRTMALMAGAALVTLASPALAEDWDFLVTNNSGKEIKTIEVSPTGANTWVANRVEEGVAVKSLKAGGRGTVHFDKAANQCRYDIKATFADDSNATWTGFNVCNNSYVILKSGGGTAFTGS